MSSSFFEYDEMEFLKLDDNKIECLHFFGYRLSGNKHTYVCNNYSKPSVIYIKQLNELNLSQVFEMLSKIKDGGK